MTYLWSDLFDKFSIFVLFCSQDLQKQSKMIYYMFERIS